jgi:photoactive yellow protein
VIELSPPSSGTTPIPFDPHTLDKRTDREIDQLPFGVIGLDPDGTILRYNLAESRLARLDRNQVLGKQFFGVVAPCTRGPDFEGRFRDFIAASDEDGILRFEFVFDFKFGAQDVVVEVVRTRGAKRYYLLVNRVKFGGVRPGLPEDFPAPLQRELAPNESSQGVRRDAVERRVIEAPWSLLAALRHTCDEVAPEGWPIFCHAWGTQWGRSLAVDLETEALEAFGISIREVPLRTAMEMLARMLARQGWGALRVDFATAPRGAVVAQLERSALAEAAGSGGGTHRCQLVAGLLGAVFTHFASSRVSVREALCRARGDETCTFVAVPERLREPLESIISSDTRDLTVVLARLQREARRG